MHSKCIIDIEHLSPIRVDRIMELSYEVQEQETWSSDLNGVLMASLFLEPSTRTRFSFDAAMLRLGGKIISANQAEELSLAKGEQLIDVLKSIAEYVDLIVLRSKARLYHYEVDELSIPLINAGDGEGQHPTQALVDLFTIKEHFARLGDLNVLFIGDCKHARTIHSLARLLLRYNSNIYCCTPENMEIPKDNIEEKNKKKVMDITPKALEDCLKIADVVYLVRYQKERHQKYSNYLSEHEYTSKYGITTPQLELMSQNSIVMHPFPRGLELPTSIDSNYRAAYFEQQRNATLVRTAILREVFEREEEE